MNADFSEAQAVVNTKNVTKVHFVNITTPQRRRILRLFLKTIFFKRILHENVSNFMHNSFTMLFILMKNIKLVHILCRMGQPDNITVVLCVNTSYVDYY